MRVMSPSMLWWSMLMLVPLVLWLFRPRPKTQLVTTLPFFRALAREHQESAWLRRLKRLLALLLTLLVLGGAISALSQFVRSPAAGDPEAVVLLFDVSASMGAKDADGESRLERAVTQALDNLPGLGRGAEITVMTHDTNWAVKLPATLNRRAVRAALLDLKAKPVTTDPAEAVIHARKNLSFVSNNQEQDTEEEAKDRYTEIWHFTDQKWQESKVESKDESETDGSGEDNASDEGKADDQSEEKSDADKPTLYDEEIIVDKTRIKYRLFNQAMDKWINVGITAFDVARLRRQTEYEALITLSYFENTIFKDGKELSPDHECRVNIKILIEGQQSVDRTISLRPNTQTPITHRFPGDANKARRARIVIESAIVVMKDDAGKEVPYFVPLEQIGLGEGGEARQASNTETYPKSDALSVDNAAFAIVPKMNRLRAIWVRAEPNIFTKLGLEQLVKDGFVEIYEGEPGQWPQKETYDVVIFDGWLPDEFPKDVGVIAINPPGRLGPISVNAIPAGIEEDQLRAAATDHPLLYGVDTQRLAVMQTSRIEINNALQPLWIGGEGPVLAAGEVEGQRIIVLAVDPLKSRRLTIETSFVMLLGNMVYWAGERPTPSVELDSKALTAEELNRAANHRTGEVRFVDADSAQWSQTTSINEDSTKVDLIGGTLVMDRVGFWDAGDDVGSSSLLFPAETELATATAATDTQDVEASSSWLRGDLTLPILYLLLTFLLLESYLFHRHAVY